MWVPPVFLIIDYIEIQKIQKCSCYLAAISLLGTSNIEKKGNLPGLFKMKNSFVLERLEDKIYLYKF